MSKLTTGTYEKYGASYKTLTLTDGEYAFTVTPEKGGMATSFTKTARSTSGCATRILNPPTAPAAASPFCSPTAASPMTAYITSAARPIPSRSTVWPTCFPGRSRLPMIPPLS